MRLVILFSLLSINGFAQTILYSPNRKLEKVVDKGYYDAEIIYLENTSKNSVDLQFELIENTFLNAWSAAFCTNTQCFNKVPNSGSLGTLVQGQQAYIQFNFGANETIGQGEVKLHITSVTDNTVNDTVTFKYTVTETGGIAAGPWAKMKYSQGVLTTFIENPGTKTNILISNLEGKLIFSQELGHITSFALRDFPRGMYVAVIYDENGRVLKEKVLHYW